MSDTTNLAEVLRDAADYLDRNGWIQRDTYSSVAGRCGAPAACVMGALTIAAVGRPVDCDDEDFDLCAFAVVVDAADVFAEYVLGPQYLDELSSANVGQLIAGWNDRNGRCAEEVVSALRAAADLRDRSNGGAA